MKREVWKEKKGLIITLTIFLLLVIPFLFYLFFFHDFRIQNFKNTISVNVNLPFEVDKIKACYGNIFQCHEVTYEIENKVDIKKIGTYQVIYKLKYQNHEERKEQTVIVEDKIAPTIEIKGEKYTVCPNGEAPSYQVSAIDNYDGEITDKIKKTLRENKMIYEIEDSSGNKTTKAIEVEITDIEKPTLTLKGEKTLYLELNQQFNEPGYEANDHCDGDLTKDVIVEGSVDTTKSGEYKLTYKIKDKQGNENIAIRTVFVYTKNSYDAPSGKSIYLTFDDGPGPYTQKLLDILKKYNVKATFFVTNQGITKGYDQDIVRAYQEGHTIGLHTYTHDYKTVYYNEQTYFDDLYAIQRKVKDLTGYESKIIRFPGGSSNTISRGNKGLMSRLTKLVEQKGFRYFDWNIVSGDAGETTKTNEVLKNVIKGLGNNSTYVVLQHDIKGFSVDAVESIIQYGLAHGYTFRPLTMDSPTVHHRVNN